MSSADAAAEVRTHLLRTPSATLCTLAVKRDVAGYPFGSVVPFALTADGRPLIYTAGIAAHTANLKADPRASLFVRQPDVEGDPQSGWRVTVMGEWEPVDPTDPQLEEIEARYTQRVPAATSYRETHDFGFWRMRTVEKVRYIGGFGKIYWLGGDAVLRDPHGEGIGGAAPGAIEHMNDDHADALMEMCASRGISPESATMTGLDRTGMFVRATGPDRLLYFPFESEITAESLRAEVIGVLRRCRG